MTNSPSKITYKPLPSDDPTQRCPDIGLARERLGWEPTIQLREGLAKTVEYFEYVSGEVMMLRSHNTALLPMRYAA